MLKNPKIFRGLYRSTDAWSFFIITIIVFSGFLLVNDPTIEPPRRSLEKINGKEVNWSFGGPVASVFGDTTEYQAGVLVGSPELAPSQSLAIQDVTTNLSIDGSLISSPYPSHGKLKDVRESQKARANSLPIQSLPEAKNYFTLPARGWNWGELHYDNAVDIADKCGSPVYAAAEGLVIEESGDGNWNQGYGNYILIEHPNGTRTKYAHTGKNLVKVGDYVRQGAEIAEIGASGKTHGPSGCHLHFEVRGAKNPFAIR